MTVKELIEQLKQFSDDQIVIVAGCSSDDSMPEVGGAGLLANEMDDEMVATAGIDPTDAEAYVVLFT